MDNIINIIKKSQEKYLDNKKKEVLKKRSQFFTPYDIACRMVDTINFEEFNNLDKIYILEPSAGCGILIAVLIKEILINLNNVKELYIDAYENDKEIANLLKNNLIKLKREVEEKNNITIKYRVVKENFIIKNKNKWNSNNRVRKYDIIISNPPYKKINQESEEAKIMSSVIYGQPNLYTLFIAMSLKLLKTSGVYTVLSPRNYLTGEYSKKIRGYIFELYSLTHIHSFGNRNIFPSVNQEVIISTYVGVSNNRIIDVLYNGKLSFTTKFNDIILDRNSMSIVVPRTKSDMKILKRFTGLNYSLEDLGLKVNVGPIVQFRQDKYLSREVYSKEYAPIVIANDIQRDNEIVYYTRENKRKTHKKSISIQSKKLIANNNYLLLRKVSAKDDESLIVCAVLENNYFNHHLIGLDNNLLYFLKEDNSSLSLEECYGLYCFINSNEFSSFYSIINGTHTINVTDFSKVKFPSYNMIISMGRAILNSKIYSKENCTKLLNEYL